MTFQAKKVIGRGVQLKENPQEEYWLERQFKDGSEKKRVWRQLALLKEICDSVRLDTCLLNLEEWWNFGRHKGLKILWINFRAGSSPVSSTNDTVAKRKGKRPQPADRKLKSLLRLHKMTLLRGGNSCSNV